MCVQRLTVETGGLNERQLTELQRTVKNYKGNNITNSFCRRPDGSSEKKQDETIIAVRKHLMFSIRRERLCFSVHLVFRCPKQ